MNLSIKTCSSETFATPVSVSHMLASWKIGVGICLSQSLYNWANVFVFDKNNWKYKTRNKKRKLLSKNRRDLQMISHKHNEAQMIFFNNLGCLFQSEEEKIVWTHWKIEKLQCVHIHLSYYDWKKHVIVAKYQLDFRVSISVFHPEITVFFQQSFLFFSYFCVIGTSDSLSTCWIYKILGNNSSEPTFRTFFYQ